MQIKLNLQIFIFLIIFYFTKQIESFCTLMIFAVIHELAHIVIGILLGLKPKMLKIMPFGFSIYFEKYKKGNNKKLILEKIMIILAGPCSNFLIAIIAIWIDIHFWNISRETIIYSNLLIGFFNLIPIYPLDGGRIVKYILQLFKKGQKALDITNTTAYVTILLLTILSSILILYIHNIAILVIIAYLWTIVILENKKYKLKKRVYAIIENEKKSNYILQ